MSDRTIKAIDPTKPLGPQLLARFQIGDEVAHINIGDGIVTSLADNCVHVAFSAGRGSTRGIYDEIWFETHPHFLFHRNTEPPQ